MKGIEIIRGFSRNACIKLLLMVFLLLFVPLAARAQESDGPDAGRVKDIAKKLLAVAGEPEKKLNYDWPPEVAMTRIQGEEDNAMASLCGARYCVSVDEELVKNIGGNDDHLAWVIGHELAHILLGHVDDVKALELLSDIPFTMYDLSREAEYEADKKGMELATAAGYSFKNAVAGVVKTKIPSGYTFLKSVSMTHPTWEQRLEKLDEDHAPFWRAFGAFEMGVFLLYSEQYEPAETCFERVIKEFPDAYEAYINLGYAQLMMYMDDFTPEMLKERGSGEIVTGFYYTRSESLDGQIKGERGGPGEPDEDLWWSVVNNLKEGLLQNPDSALGNASLAVALFFNFSREDVNMGEVHDYFDAAIKALDKDPSVDTMGRATVFINAAAANLGTGEWAVSEEQLADARRELDRFMGFMPSGLPVTSAFLHNSALMLSMTGEPEDAARALETITEYLTTTNSASKWWPAAFDLYTRLCMEQNVAPLGEDELKSEFTNTSRMRPISHVRTADGKVLSLVDTLDAALEMLGESEAIIPIIGLNSKLREYCYPSQGISIIGGKDSVLAIKLYGPNAPAIELRAKGAGEQPVTVKPGANMSGIEPLLGNAYSNRKLTSHYREYRYYQNIGVGFDINKDTGEIVEIVIANIP